MLVVSLLILLSNEAGTSLHPVVDSLQSNTFVCGNTRSFTQASGSIHSPGYPKRYPSNTYCTYDITVDWGFRVELTWKDFDIDGDMPHCNSATGDYVEAFTGCGAKRRLLARFCSRNSVIPHALYSVDNCMSLHLFTRPEELAKTSKGFLAEYRAVNRSEVMTYQKCNRTFTRRSGVIHSTFWPHTYQYGRLDKCNWHLKVDEAMAVQFTFMDLNTYNEFGSHDAVVIQGLGSFYVSKASWQEFYGRRLPFLYKAWYNELVVNWRIKPGSYYTDRFGGFIAGYVAYRPVDRDMAEWQYALLGFAAVLGVYCSLVFSCRHSLRQQSAKRRRYRRLVNMNSSQDDIPVVNGPAGNEHLEEQGEGRVRQDPEVDTGHSQPPLRNDIQLNGSRDSSVVDFTGYTNPGEPGTLRMRDFSNIYSHTHSQDTLTRSNVRVEAIFHPLPLSVQQQPTFENHTPHEVEDTNSADIDNRTLLDQPDVMDPVTAALPSASACSDSLPTTSVPPTSASLSRTPSTSIPQASTTEPGQLQNGSAFLAGATAANDVSNHIEPIYNMGFVDDERPENDSTLNKPENVLSSDSGIASEAIVPNAPPPYQEIYEELQSLSQIVADIISDIG